MKLSLGGQTAGSPTRNDWRQYRLSGWLHADRLALRFLRLASVAQRPINCVEWTQQCQTSRAGWAGWGRIKVAEFPLAGASCYRYWPVAALSVADTRTATTLARLMITPFWLDSRSYRAWVKTRLRRSSSA